MLPAQLAYTRLRGVPHSILTVCATDGLGSSRFKRSGKTDRERKTASWDRCGECDKLTAKGFAVKLVNLSTPPPTQSPGTRTRAQLRSHMGRTLVPPSVLGVKLGGMRMLPTVNLFSRQCTCTVSLFGHLWGRNEPRFASRFSTSPTTQVVSATSVK